MSPSLKIKLDSGGARVEFKREGPMQRDPSSHPSPALTLELTQVIDMVVQS